MTVGRRKRRHYDDGRAVLQLRRVARLSVAGVCRHCLKERATLGIVATFEVLLRRTPDHYPSSRQTQDLWSPRIHPASRMSSNLVDDAEASRSSETPSRIKRSSPFCAENAFGQPPLQEEASDHLSSSGGPFQQACDAISSIVRHGSGANAVDHPTKLQGLFCRIARRSSGMFQNCRRAEARILPPHAGAHR